MQRTPLLLFIVLNICCRPSMAGEVKPLTSTLGIERLEAVTLPLGEHLKIRTQFIHRPWFTPDGTLHWDERPVTEGTAVCRPPDLGVPWQSPPRCRLKSLMLRPRVDQCRCEGALADDTPVAWESYQGGDGATWQRHHCDEGRGQCSWLAGISRNGLVWDDHSVWSVASGETLRPAAPKLPRQRGISLWLPQQQRFVEFAGSAHLLSAEGGLWLADPASGERRLLHPIDAGLTGFWRGEALAQLPGTELLVLLENWSTRGLGELRLTLLSADGEQRLYRESLAKDCLCSDLHIEPGPNGHFAISFYDNDHYRLLHYRLISHR